LLCLTQQLSIGGSVFEVLLSLGGHQVTLCPPYWLML